MAGLWNKALLLSQSNIKHLIATGDVAPLRGHVFDVRLSKLKERDPWFRVRVIRATDKPWWLMVSLSDKLALFELDVSNKELTHVEDVPYMPLSMDDL